MVACIHLVQRLGQGGTAFTFEEFLFLNPKRLTRLLRMLPTLLLRLIKILTPT